MNKWRSFLITLVFYYFPVFAWMGLIFYLSSIPGLKTGVSSVGLEIFFRKIAHLGEYFILTFLVWRVSKKHFSLLVDFNKTLFLSFTVVLSFAITDEIHQYFVEDRAGRVVDVFTDGLGAFLFLMAIIYFSKIKKRQ
jgi:VanZ family protein